MDRLAWGATPFTPRIDLNPETGILAFEGSSCSEEIVGFYRPIVAWMHEYLATLSGRPVEVIFTLRRLNASSVKVLLGLLDLLQQTFDRGSRVEVVWKFHPNDPTQEVGTLLLDGIRFPYRLVAEG